MKLKYIGFLFLLLGLQLYGQNDKNVKAYKRMEGKIGEKIDVTANFIQLFGKVKGNYQYKFEKRRADEVTTYYGKMIELNGELYDDDSVRFKEAGSGDYTIKGVWGVDFFNGKWKIPGEDDYMDMMLKEYYPDGSLPFKVYYLESDQKLIPARKDSPTATLELTFIYPSGNFKTPEAEAKVKKTIVKSFFGDGIKPEVPDKMLRDFESEYYKMYADNKENWLEIGGSSFSWEMMKSMNVKFNSDYLLSIEYFRYAYSGGAHGMENLSYDVFNLATGKKLEYQDIFTESADTVLSALLTEKMIEKYKTKNGSTLKEVGFFVDTIEPNNNIYVTGNGVGFQYSSYEIAPYSFGLPEVFLDFDEVKDLLRKDSPVYKLTGRQR